MNHQIIKKKILLVDDEPELLELVHEVLLNFLDASKFEVKSLQSSRDALNELLTNSYEILITDYRMAELNGIDLIEQILKSKSEINCFLLTGDLEVVLPESIKKIKMIQKPVGLDQLVKEINSI